MEFVPVTWLIPATALAVGLVVAVIVSTILARLAISGGPVDNPRERGSHSQPTPTSGGLAVMAATLAGLGAVLLLFPQDVPGVWREGLALIAFALIMGVSGALDDLFDWPARWRLLFQITVCLAFAAAYPVTFLTFGFGLQVELPWVAGWLGSAAWLVLGLNAINFMDGANGLAPGTQTIALLVVGWLMLMLGPLSTLGPSLGIFLLISVCAAGAHLGFAPFNIGGKVFQGDAGALFGGALITGLTLVMKAKGVASAWLGGFMLAPILVDVVLTLITRTFQRKNVFQPHREHLYQLWLTHADPSHARLALKLWWLCAASSFVGVSARLIDQAYGTDVRFPSLVAVIVAYSLGWVVVRRHLLRKAV